MRSNITWYRTCMYICIVYIMYMYIYLHIYMIYGYIYISYILINACSACRRSWNRYDFRSRIFAYFQGRYSGKKNIAENNMLQRMAEVYRDIHWYNAAILDLLSKHSILIQFWYMLKWSSDVGQQHINVGSTSYCQSLTLKHRWILFDPKNSYGLMLRRLRNYRLYINVKK